MSRGHMKRTVSQLLAICMILSLSGCAKCISTNYQNVEVRIVDKYHRGMYFIPIHVGKTTNMIYYPAIYRITVEYDGTEYTISGRDIYEKYSERVGEFAVGCLRVRDYDDGTTEYDIIGLSDKGGEDDAQTDRRR